MRVRTLAPTAPTVLHVWRLLVRAVFAALLLLSTAWAVPAFSQSAADKARIDYETAKKAVQQGRHDIALTRLESVLGVLGEQPEILVTAAECALAMKDDEKAAGYVKRAFAAADPKFRSTPPFQKLVEVAADLEVAQEAKTPKKSIWRKPYDSLCTTEYHPVTPTWTRVVKSRLDNEEAKVVRKRVTAIGRDSVDFEGSVDGSSVHFSNGCDAEGILVEKGSGYSLPRAIEPGRTTWTASSAGGDETSNTDCDAKGTARVQTALGQFDAVVVECRSTSVFEGKRTYRSISTKWLVSGIGDVKSRLEITPDARDGGRPSIHTWDLLEWTP